MWYLCIALRERRTSSFGRIAAAGESLGMRCRVYINIEISLTSRDVFIMAFIYTVVERKNPFPNAKSERIASAMPKQLGRVTLRELADDIADRCTLHRADVVAVLEALSVSTISFLKKGLGVSLGEMGSFGVRLKSKSAPTKEEFDRRMIERVLVRYTPSTFMKDDLNKGTLRSLESLLAERKQQEGEQTGGASNPQTGNETNPQAGNETGGNGDPASGDF